MRNGRFSRNRGNLQRLQERQESLSLSSREEIKWNIDTSKAASALQKRAEQRLNINRTGRELRGKKKKLPEEVVAAIGEEANKRLRSLLAVSFTTTEILREARKSNPSMFRDEEYVNYSFRPVESTRSGIVVERESNFSVSDERHPFERTLSYSRGNERYLGISRGPRDVVTFKVPLGKKKRDAIMDSRRNFLSDTALRMHSQFSGEEVPFLLCDKILKEDMVFSNRENSDISSLCRQESSRYLGCVASSYTLATIENSGKLHLGNRREGSLLEREKALLFLTEQYSNNNILKVLRLLSNPYSPNPLLNPKSRLSSYVPSLVVPINILSKIRGEERTIRKRGPEGLINVVNPISDQQAIRNILKASSDVFSPLYKYRVILDIHRSLSNGVSGYPNKGTQYSVNHVFRDLVSRPTYASSAGRDIYSCLVGSHLQVGLEGEESPTFGNTSDIIDICKGSLVDEPAHIAAMSSFTSRLYDIIETSIRSLPVREVDCKIKFVYRKDEEDPSTKSLYMEVEIDVQASFGITHHVVPYENTRELIDLLRRSVVEGTFYHEENGNFLIRDYLEDAENILPNNVTFKGDTSKYCFSYKLFKKKKVNTPDLSIYQFLSQFNAKDFANSWLGFMDMTVRGGIQNSALDFYNHVGKFILSLLGDPEKEAKARDAFLSAIHAQLNHCYSGSGYDTPEEFRERFEQHVFNKAEQIMDAVFWYKSKILMNNRDNSMIDFKVGSPKYSKERLGKYINTLVYFDTKLGQFLYYSLTLEELKGIYKVVRLPRVITDGVVIDSDKRLYVVTKDDLVRARVFKNREVTLEQAHEVLTGVSNNNSESVSGEHTLNDTTGLATEADYFDHVGFDEAPGDEESEEADQYCEEQIFSLYES